MKSMSKGVKCLYGSNIKENFIRKQLIVITLIFKVITEEVIKLYCVIQEMELKKENTYGAYKELEVDSTSGTDYSTGETKTWYSYKQTGERFKRPIKKAYKISIHDSYREDGKVKKKQWSICTISYYEIAEGWSWIGDHTIGLKDKIKDIGIIEENLYEMVYKKLDPLVEQIQEEFCQTEEHTIKTAHDITIKEHIRKKGEFEKIYGGDTYDYCYDVFGELRNKEMLDSIKRQYEEAQKQQRSYYESYQSNYNSYSNSSSYSTMKQSNYNDNQKEYLKKIYRAAAVKLHPDIVKDDGAGMKFLNELKENWGI